MFCETSLKILTESRNKYLSLLRIFKRKFYEWK